MTTLEQDREYYRKNRQRLNQNCMKYQKRHPEMKAKHDKRYYLKNKSRILEYHKQYYQKNKERILERSRRYNQRIDIKPRLALMKKLYNSRDYVKFQNSQKYYIKRQDPNFVLKERERHRQWKLNHPDKILKESIKRLQKEAAIYDKSVMDYRVALYAWARQVKKLANGICQICNKPANHAHHIFPKALYPKLAFNLNNGIALCKEHHYEIHYKVIENFGN